MMFVGHSHIRSLAKGAELSGRSIVTLSLGEQFKKASREELRAELGPLVTAVVRENAAGRVFCLVGGGLHAAMGIVQHPERLDFVMPDRPDLPFDNAAALVPSTSWKA